MNTPSITIAQRILPLLMEYSENTKKYNYLRSYKTIWIYAVFLYGLYCLVVITSIDMTLFPLVGL